MVKSFQCRLWWSRGDYWLYLIILLALGLRTYHIAYPSWDYHNWRQTQTLMVARDFARHDFQLLHPRVQWVSNNRPSDPSYFSGEFSIESVLAALLYKLFGENEALARTVVIMFSLLGIYFLYELLNRRAGPIAARIGAFIYALLPYHLFFGRVFMPDVPALTFALGGLLLLDRWTDDRRQATLFAAAALTAMAVLQKLTVIFVGLPLLYLFWLAYGRHLFARRELYFFAAIVGAPSLAWYVHANAMALHSGFAFVQPGLFGRNLGVWFQPGFFYRIVTALYSEAFSPLGLGLSILGFFLPARSPAFWIFRLWIAGAGLLLLLIPDLLSANYYYLSLLLPGGAALGGLGLARLAPSRTAYPLLAIVLTVFATGAISSTLPLYNDDRAPRDLGVLLNHLTAPADLIVGETGGSPNMLYFADRRGWMLAHQYDAGLLRQLANAGALYYADPSTADLVGRREFFRAMDANFERLTIDEETWPIYRLSAPSEPLRQLPADEIRNPLRVNFGGQIELLGVSLRELAQSPTSFELLYFWRCLKESATSLQITVRVAHPTGEVAYQSTRTPLTGSHSSAKWKLGEIIRERNVVVLPGSLSQGMYQICVSWSDPVRAARLAILKSDAKNEQGCAQVGKVEIRQTPNYGWFAAN